MVSIPYEFLYIIIGWNKKTSKIIFLYEMKNKSFEIYNIFFFLGRINVHVDDKYFNLWGVVLDV